MEDVESVLRRRHAAALRAADGLSRMCDHASAAAIRRLFADQVKAMTDPVSGLVNRIYFYKRLNAAVLRSRLKGTPLVVGMSDVSYVNYFNYIGGNDAGDKLIRETATGLARVFGPTFRVICRYGGDEFAMFGHGDAVNAMSLQAELNDHLIEKNPLYRLDLEFVTLKEILPCADALDITTVKGIANLLCGAAGYRAQIAKIYNRMQMFAILSASNDPFLEAIYPFGGKGAGNPSMEGIQDLGRKVAGGASIDEECLLWALKVCADNARLEDQRMVTTRHMAVYEVASSVFLTST